ncbi:putative 2-aminoethylphosphonate-binding periplasmic protein precursor [Hartmannibacter diazotrophicus]|uniref:Putative 2-aminoethylphosphonate-binding periplasmic protein n=1 Tax=Hartmannibacter diazotrophicus TaxID=1482074 RepID=A0A2C9D1H7_9HYPH|nr:ABC transporter substrate-binding protein [Hartmannibacter diazotrophicus]SON54217.1 putative 2-aminoethylphosphonate-binding periplasmic protein precursor [Hartmannibacter diazotrophicus]
MKTLLRLLAAAAIGTVLAGTAQAETVTVYSAGPGGLIKKLAAGFQKKTGNEVEVFQATTGKVMARLAAEQANPVADVVISASWDTATQFDKDGLLLDYTSPNAEKVPDFLKAPTYVAQGISALAIAWNTKSGTPEPTDWSDLAKPEYKDLVTMPDPASSGSAYELVAALASDEAIGWKLFEDLSANGMIVPGANAQALNPVLQGAKAVVFGAVDYQSFGQIKKGESLKVIFPKSGTVIAPRPMMILKSSQHQDAAKAFIDYVLSDEGQAAVAGADLMPARSDVGADRPLMSDLKLLSVDPSTDRKAILAHFAEIFAAN